MTMFLDQQDRLKAALNEAYNEGVEAVARLWEKTADEALDNASDIRMFRAHADLMRKLKR